MQATIVFQKNWEAIHAECPECHGAKGDDCDYCHGSNKKYKYIINQGSSRSSKTYSLIDCFDLYARSNGQKRLTAWRDTKKSCKDTVLVDMLKHHKKTKRYKLGYEFHKTESIFTYSNDSTVEIHGTDDEETVHGLTQDAAWLNEPYKISRETFDQIDQRTSDFIFIDYNPKKGHWVEDLMKDERSIVIHSTFKDNPFCPIEQRTKILSYQPVSMSSVVLDKLLDENQALTYDFKQNPLKLSEKQIKELLRCIANENKNSASKFNWEVYGLGLKSERPNRIFKWTEIPDFDYKQLDLPVYIGCDWGTVDPWGIVEAKYNDGCLYLHELNYMSENEWRLKMNTTEQLASNAEGSEVGIVTWLFDKLQIDKRTEIICDTNRPVKIAALRRKGYNANPVRKGTILDGIELLSNLKVFYTKSSTNIKHEQENYSRKVDRRGTVLEEPEDSENHLIDPSRYICTHLQAKGVIKIF